MIGRRITIWILFIACLCPFAYSDSIFDSDGTGRDIIPAIGNTRAMGGAVVANVDPASASLLSPFAAAMADRITVTAGFAHTGTNSMLQGQEKRTISTAFPSVSAVIPFKGISFLTGLYQEKGARLTTADIDTAYALEIYDITHRMETSIHSVPILVSRAINPKLIVTGGVVLSFFDTRETTDTDFRSGDRADAEDVHDLYGSGQALAAGALVDLGLVRLAAFYRSKSDFDGNLESHNQYAGLYSSRSIGIKARQAFSVGLLFRPGRYLLLEADYQESPWDKLEIDRQLITTKSVARLAVGARYQGNWLWRASKYPLIAGYYRQPLDWESPVTGEIIEEFLSVGTAIPIGEDRASISLSFEFGRRRPEKTGDLEEKVYGFSLSVSAAEAWRRAIRR
jgi:hypothetical protein